MNIKAWMAVGVAGFASGAGVNGLQAALTGEEAPSASASTSQSGNNPDGQLPTNLGNGEFQIPEDGEITLPDGPITLPDGTVIDLDDDGGTITLPDGSTIDAPPRPGGGFGGTPRPRQNP